MMRYSHWISIAIALACLAEPALAQRRGGGGGRRGGGGGFGGGASARSFSRPSVSRPSFNPGGGGFNRPSGGRPNVDRGNISNVNRGNINNVNRGDRPINVNDVDINGDYRGDYGCCYRPVAAGVAVGAAAAVTAAAIGSTVYSLPSTCTTVIASDGVTYEHCGDAWYEPQFEGTTTTYTVVNPPQ